MTRKATWTNADGLVVGFGPNYPERVSGGVTTKKGGAVKTAMLHITYQSSGANIAIPAGSVIKGVYMKVTEAWADGTDVQVGDGSDADGFISATQGATANLTNGAMIRGGGAYLVANTDTTAQELEKVYASADTIDVSFTGTFTAGKATIVVEYV